MLDITHGLPEDIVNPRSSWLGSVANALNTLKVPAKRRKTRAEKEDERLAAIAATCCTTPQERVFMPNGTTVAIVGCGRMGIDIAAELLRRGCTVRAYDLFAFARENARTVLHAMLLRHVQDEYLVPQDVDDLLGRFTTCATLEDVSVGASLIFEMIIEDFDKKVELFQAVAQSLSDRGTPPGDVILASNTVSIPLGRLTAGLARTHREWAPRLLGVRFLRPTFTVDDVEMTMSPPLPPPAGAPPATPREALRKEETAREEAARVASCACEVAHFLKQLFFKPSMYNGGDHRNLTEDQVMLYLMRQRQTCQRDAAVMAIYRHTGGQPTQVGNMIRALNPFALAPPLDVPTASTALAPAALAPAAGTSYRRHALPTAAHSRASAPGHAFLTLATAAPFVRRPPEHRPTPPTAAAASAGAEAGLSLDFESRCSICCELPCSALIRPCGHSPLCLECAERLVDDSAAASASGGEARRPLCPLCRVPIEAILPLPPADRTCAPTPLFASSSSASSTNDDGSSSDSETRVGTPVVQ